MMVVRMLCCRVAVTMMTLEMTLLVTVMMLKCRGGVILVIVEAAVLVHDDTALAQRSR